MESLAKRFWKCENTQITLFPVNEADPRQGGRVQARVTGLDVRTFTPYSKTMYGVYGEDFLTFGQFKDNSNVGSDDSALLKLFEDAAEDVVDKHTFKFENNQVTYKREVNGQLVDTEVEHAIEESVLTPHVDQTWSETLFYGLGNKNM